MRKAERSTEVFSTSFKLAIRSYGIRLQVVAENLQNLRRASLRHIFCPTPKGNCEAEKEHNALW